MTETCAIVLGDLGDARADRHGWIGPATPGSEARIADAEPPHTPRGCPFQAWSVGEALRLDKVVLAVSEAPSDRKKMSVATQSGSARSTWPIGVS